MTSHIEFAPGWPGIPPRWTSSAKSGVGTAIGADSRVWFTLSHGILNEIYYPRVDQACIRDMGLIVTDGIDFFSEEKRHTRNEIVSLANGAPAYRLTNTCREKRYRIEKEVIADPRRDVVLQRIRFFPLQEKMENYHLYDLLAPHLGNQGAGNTAWVGDYKGNPMLFAERDGYALALASSAPWLNRSAGYVGFSDSWQDLAAHKRMTWSYLRAENGNTALAGEVDLEASGSEFVFALGFGRNAAEAGCRTVLIRFRLLISLIGNPGKIKSFHWIKNIRIQRISTGSVRLFCISTNQKVFQGERLPVFQSHGGFPRGIMISAAIIWSGPGIWWKQRGDFLPPESLMRPSGSSNTCRRRRNQTAIGLRICGWMEHPTGTAFKWTRPHFPFYS